MKRAALALLAALAFLAIWRGLTLELDPYDAYEVRASARAIAGDASSPFAIYRSALLTMLEVPFEKLGRGSRVTWAFPHLFGVAAWLGLALATVRLGRSAGLGETWAWAAGVAIALDRVAWADAPSGLPDGTAAALATLGLALGLEGRVYSVGILLGLAAAARPNAGLAGVALLAAALPRGARLKEVVVTGAIAIGLYLFLTTLFFALGRGSLIEGVRGHLDLSAFHREQFRENAARYGRLYPPLAVYLRAAPALEPAAALLAPIGLVLALRRRTPGEVALAALLIVHVLFLTLLVGHGEARYLLPAMPAVAVLGALVLERLPWERARVPALVLWVVVPLAVGAPFEARRAMDPVQRAGFSQRAAELVASVGTGSVAWTPDLPFPVYPEVLARDGTPFPGDPFHGIAHAGPLTVAYHLGRPVSVLRRTDERGAPLPGIARVEDLEAIAPRFRDGDIVIVGAAEPGLSWRLGPDRPRLRVAVVRLSEGRARIEVAGEVR